MQRDVIGAVSRFLSKKKSLLILAIIFFSLSFWILTIPHGVETGSGHMKDEEAYHAWAELYTEGVYSIPMDQARGVWEHTNSFSTDPDARNISVSVEVTSLQPDGRENDVEVSVAHANGTPAAGARVRILLPENKELNASTDLEGSASLFNIPLGRHPVEVVIERENGTLPLVLHTLVDSKSGAGVYGIYSIVEYEAITDNVLDNRTLRLLLPDGTPARNFRVSFYGSYLGVTDNTGETTLAGIDKKYGLASVRNPQGRAASGLSVFLEGNLSGRTNDKGTILLAVSDTINLNITVLDIFDRPSSDVELTLDGDMPLGRTDESGTLASIQNISFGEHRLRALRVSDKYDIPMASGIAEVDGEYHYVNHWPPGPSVLLSWFMLAGLSQLFGLFLMAVLSVGVYGLARRAMGFQVAFFATVFTMLNGVVVMLYYGQWMGDLATASFGILGMWLFVEGAERLLLRKGSVLLPMILSLVGGLGLAVSVTMRYSSVVFCLCPVVYLVWRLYPWDTPGILNRVKGLFSKRNILDALALLLPLFVGLLIIGGVLAAYNAHYFGGPFNSGYQASNQLAVTSTDENGSTTIAAYTPSKSFFETYFGYTEGDFNNMPNVLNYILIYIPVFFLCLPAFWVGRRNPLVAACFVWVAGVMVIYLAQSWVMTRVLGDIRYYLPIVPPCAILTGHLFVRLLKSGFLRPRYTLKAAFAFSFVLLLLVSSVAVSVTGVNYYTDRFSNQGPPPGGLPPPDATEVSISDLIATPAAYSDKVVQVNDAVVKGVLGPGIFLIGEGVTEVGEVLVAVPPDVQIPQVSPGNSVEVTGMFKPDDKRPGGWMIMLRNAEGLEVLGTRSVDTDSVDDGLESLSFGQGLPPPPGGGMPGLVLSPAEHLARFTAVFALALLWGMGAACMLHRRKTRSA